MVFFVILVLLIDSYDDLKPPTSPTPTPPIGQKESGSPVGTISKPASADAQTSSPEVGAGVSEEKPAQVEGKIRQPLSPYAA